MLNSSSRAVWIWAVFAGADLCACSTGLSLGTGSGQSRTTTGRLGTSAAAGAGSGGGSPSTTGAGSGGSTGGTIGAPTCDATWVVNWYDGGSDPTDCAAGLTEMKGRVVDACQGGQPLAESNLSVTDFYNPSLVADTSLGCGAYFFCVDAGTLVTPLFRAAGYADMLAGTIEVAKAGELGVSGRLGLGLFCDLVVSDLQGTSQGLVPSYDPQRASVYVRIAAAGLDGGPCAETTGWTFALRDAAGGLVDAGSAFLVGLSATQGDAGTLSFGAQLLYDIDPSIGVVTVEAQRAGDPLPDGGQLCPPLTILPPWQFTGAVPLSEGTISYFPYGVP